MRSSVTLALALAAGLASSVSALGADLPLRNVTLYRSGVGYFEFTGTVEGDEDVTLTFRENRVNDILKSMVLLDYGGGRISGVTYEPKQTLGRRINEFRINPNQAGSLSGLLRQLRGEQVLLKTTGGDVTGAVMGVERRPVAIGSDDKTKPVEDWAVTLLTVTGVTTVDQADIRSLQILDESLAKELTDAFAAVAGYRNDLTTALTIQLDGAGERNVAVAYTHGAPVWKTSYRLILPDGTNAAPSLQGWAIVENDTDDDWENVRLSLASGRPVSFEMDLQTPLILDRPNVPVPVIAMLAPEVYQSGRSMAPAQRDALEKTYRRELAGAAPSADFALAESGMTANDMVDYGADSVASATEVGEQFMYTIDGPVTIGSGQSSMLPILSGPIEGRRLTIYSWRGANSRPMRGVELTNNTGLHLMPGPIAVYDAGAYAGDAQIDHLSRGSERLISFAVDHDLDVTREVDVRQDTVRLRIVDGLVERRWSSLQTTTYAFVNNDSDARTILLEHPKNPGWDLRQTEDPTEQTDSLYRFEVAVGAGDTVEFPVTLERTWLEQVSTDSFDLDEMLGYVRSGKASQAVYDAVRTAAAMRGEINRLEAQIREIDQATRRISEDQSRIRSNMNAVGRQAELYARLLQKLEEQEDQLDRMLTQRDELQTTLEQKTRELRQYLSGLDIE